MSTEAGFIQALRDDPSDDETRLIYADWLDERGDPRGEFFRVQVRLADGVADLDERRRLHQRSRDLLAAHEARWLGPLAKLCESVWWRRGQPVVTLSARTVLQASLARRAAQLFEQAVVAEARVVNAPQNIRPNLVESPVFQHLPHLVLDGLDLDDYHLARLVQNPHFRGFRSLSLAGNNLGHVSVNRLLTSPAADGLVALDLRNNRLHDASFWAIANSDLGGRLRDLRLHGNPLGPIGLAGYVAWRTPRLAASRRVNSVGMELTYIAPGTYLRGSPDDEPGRYPDEGPRRAVTISRGFYLAAFQTTQDEYQRVTGSNPARFHPGNGGGLNHPVEMVSWEEAAAFCERLSRLPDEAAAGHRYRLPTEAEWEYAARCGWDDAPLPDNRTPSAWLANYGGSPGRTVPVGSYPPTPWGHYDLAGNLWDWSADWYGDYPEAVAEPAVDPTGPETGSQRVLRGASWYGPSRNLRCACRGSDSPTIRDHYYGFRVLLEVP